MMNHRALTLAITAAAIGTIATTQADLLFYEGFNYTDGTSLHGQGGWSNDPNDTYDGTSPATVGNTGSDDPFDIFDGTGGEAWDGDFTGVTQTGNFAGYAGGHMFATRSLDPSVTATFTAGSTTWLSFINYRTSSRGADLSIGAGPLTGDRSRYAQDENVGMGQIYNNASSRALTWAGGGAQYVTSAATLGGQQPQFLIAKIVWGASPAVDTITVVKFLETDTISEANFNAATQSTLTGDFGQSLFDTINIGGAQCFVDEIRIATTFADAVTGLPVAGTTNADNSAVAASPAVVPNDGTTTSTITVTLRDDDSIPVPGRDVTLTGNTGNATITPVNPTTDATGEATFTVSSSTAETEVFTAEDVTGGGSIVITETASVTFEDPTVVDPGTSTVTASPADVPADDSTTSTVTVTLKTGLGFPIPGKDVSLAAAPTGATITPINSTTDVNGEAAFTVRSATSGTVEFTATDVTGGGSTAITQTTNVVFTVVAPTPTLLFHEPFDYAAGSDLDSQGGWNAGSNTGGGFVQVFDGDGSDGEAWDGTFSGVAQSGNFAGRSGGTADHMWGDHALDPTVTATFTDGAVTWFSFITYNGGSPMGSIGADVLQEDRGQKAAGQNIGMGGSFNNSAVRALYWDDEDTNGTYEWHGSATTFSNQNPQFLLGRIVWSDTPGQDSITVARFSSGSTIDQTAWDGAAKSTISADLDQSAFDTVNFHGSRYYIDEIRIATTLDLAVNGTSGGGNDYADWVADNYPGLGAPGDDDDGDGLSNDEERIFGLNPTSGASVNPYVIPFDAATGGFSYSRRTQSLTGLIYTVWYSTDLEEWFEDTGATEGTITELGEVETVPVTLSISPAGGKLFVQVRAAEDGG